MWVDKRLCLLILPSMALAAYYLYTDNFCISKARLNWAAVTNIP